MIAEKRRNRMELEHVYLIDFIQFKLLQKETFNNIWKKIKLNFESVFNVFVFINATNSKYRKTII